MNDNEIPEDLGIVVLTEQQKFWEDVKTATEKRILQMEEGLHLEKNALQLAKEKIETLK